MLELRFNYYSNMCFIMFIMPIAQDVESKFSVNKKKKTFKQISYHHANVIKKTFLSIPLHILFFCINKIKLMCVFGTALVLYIFKNFLYNVLQKFHKILSVYHILIRNKIKKLFFLFYYVNDIFSRYIFYDEELSLYFSLALNNVSIIYR